MNAETAIVCPGTDFLTLFPERIAAYGVTTCKLHMLRVDPRRRAGADAAVMSDLGLVRYLGYAELPEAAALKRRLEAEQAAALEHGVHLIAVRSATAVWWSATAITMAPRPIRSRRRSSMTSSWTSSMRCSIFRAVAFSNDGSATMRRRRIG